MADRPMVTVDANEAVALVAHRLSEVIAIYPITPSSTMGELADDYSAKGKKNIWGSVPDVAEMQSEGGAAGAVHGALQAGSLSTTFTASQGLLLMIPNMYKIAGELNSFVMHVTARALAAHALSIFGDHSDVMACRQTGFAMLCSNNGQEAADLALISHAATLKSRLPFLHFFDGFRTSHEVAKIEMLLDDDLRAMMDDDLIAACRERALTPDRPIIRGTAQNPDVYFQAREACNPFYLACPEVVQDTMDQFAALTGRQYHLFDYVGAPDAERVIVMMGSGAECAHETVEHLVAQGEKVGLVKIRLYRPFDLSAFVKALPATVQSIAVLDRFKEPGALGEPLYLDVVSALHEAAAEGILPGAMPKVIGGRYGLSSKEFNPAMVQAVYDELAAARPKAHFTVGILDDVTHLSLPVDASYDIEPADVVRAVFFGLGSDGTVGANRNSIKIIGEETPNYAQAYFVYDSKKSGSMTISHLRFGPRPIRSTYLIKRASFVGCHMFEFMDKYDVLEYAAEGAVFLLNAPYKPEEVWDHLPVEAQRTIIDRKLQVYTIDAVQVARETGMGGRINTIMQTCFFAISGVLPRDEAIAKIKEAAQKTYGKKGEEIVKRNWAAIDATLAHLSQVQIPAAPTTSRERPPIISPAAPQFLQDVTAKMMRFEGDNLPVSAFEPSGSWPTATTQWEKRNIAIDIPIWDPTVCIQCNKCALVCPHGAIRAKVYDPALLGEAPAEFRSTTFKAKDFAGQAFTIQVAPEDCTGCTLCVNVCPAKDKANPKHKAINMELQLPIRERERANYGFFLGLPEVDRTKIERLDAKFSQFMLPLFEYSGACAGCGETPYVKLMTQLFGDRLLMANATGCSSIYGGNLPTTPYCQDAQGRGPAWSNSLFEDNAEFGFGMRLAVDSHDKMATELLVKLAPEIGDDLVDAIVNGEQHGEANIKAQRERVAALKAKLATMAGPAAKRLLTLADYLVRKSVWIMGGDGWAYDIGFGGLDHVMAQGRDVNILVLDTEVYSNTGGQASKSTPIGAAAKFAASGKAVGKKDLGLMAMSYRNVYVASVAMGARDNQSVQAFVEADSYPGTSIIIAYSHCIAHGFDLSLGMEQQKLAVNSGIWPMYRYDPRRIEQNLPPLQLDSGAPKERVQDYMRNEQRFRMVEKIDPVRFRHLAEMAQIHSSQRVAVYEQMAKIIVPAPAATNGDASE
ncbi:MAG: pyruvate:ferredoxin (flavodoxin) oxidoreductase [Fimbriimonadaceae bacterium]|nr:pyruvate:ferredoxin (flavodoxin) oxidoreductase [Fimbriimonadaceae bacterium]